MMFKYFRYSLLIIILGLAACFPQTVKTPGITEKPTEPGDFVIQEAEQFFTQEIFNEALPRFVQYLSQFPRGRYTDFALYRIGEIYRRQGQAGAAQAFYQRLLEEYPDSAYAGQSRLAVIDLMAVQGRTDEALAAASQMLDNQITEKIRVELWRRMTGLSSVKGDWATTAKYAYMLYKASREPEKSQWAQLLQDSIARLDGDGVMALWDLIDDSRMRSFLMYRYATVQVAQENYDDALDILAVFIRNYPNHRFAAKAAGLIQTLEERMTFEPFRLGCLLPLTGAYKIYGARALNALELALSTWQSGESTPPIRLVIKDTKSQDSEAVQAVRELAREKVGIILGSITTAQAAAQEAQRQQIPMLTFTQKPDVTAIGDYIFRHFITPRAQVKTLVDYFIKEVGLREFAILYPQDTYGQTFMGLFWDETVRQGGRIVGVETYSAEQTDFAETIKKLTGTHYSVPEDLKAPPVVRVEQNRYFRMAAASNDLEEILPDPVNRLTGLYYEDSDPDHAKGPAIGRRREDEGDTPIVDFDVLFIPDAPKMTGLIIPQLAYHDVQNIYLAGTNLWHSQQLIEMTKDYIQGAVMVDGFFKDSTSEVVQNFVETYRGVYGQDPGLIEAFVFDSARFVFGLLARSDIRMRHILRDALGQIFDEQGVTGSTAFDENGEAVKRLLLLKVKGDRFIEIPHP